MAMQSTNPEADARLFDPWTREYAMLGLRMERLAPGTVDAWTGPPSWRTATEAEPKVSPEALRDAAAALLEALPGMGYAPQRETYLRKQVIALHAQARILGDEAIPFTEQAALYFDIHPEREPEETFAAAHAQLEELLLGEGSLAERRAAWRKQFLVPPEQVTPILEKVIAEVRARTARHVPLPEGESIEIRLVNDRAWGAYNWYKGNAHSLIEVNTDLPTYADNLVDYMAHEGYPGHHTEHAMREIEQYRRRGQGEYAIQLINTPESMVAEAIAVSARPLLFPRNEDMAWMAQAVLPELGITADWEEMGRVREASRRLRSVSSNAAFLLHEDGRPPEEVAAYLERWSLRNSEEARHHLQFLQSPLWRVYTFTYDYGERLLEPMLSGPDPIGEFLHILTEPVYPEMLAARSDRN